MNGKEAMQCALGYAWGSEDASGVKAVSGIRPDISGSTQFAKAFAQGWDDYNTGKRWSMIPVGDAYKVWQESCGKGIFPEGQTTADVQRRAAAHFAERAATWR